MTHTPTLKAAPGDRFRLKQLFTLAPANGDHHVGLRTAVGVMLPLLSLLWLGRLDLAPYAVFGAFVGVYSRVPGHLDRLLMQVKAAGLMWFVLLAAWFTGSYVVDRVDTPVGNATLVATTTVVAGLASVAAGFLRLRPAGSLFHIFAFAAVASLTRQPGIGDAMFTATAVMVFALVLGQLGRIAPVRRTPWLVTPVPPFSRPMSRAIWAEGWAYALAAGVAGTLAAVLAGPLGMGHTYWAMVAGVVPLAGKTTRHRLVRAVHRTLGTAGGLLIMALLVWVQPPVWVAVIVIGVMQFLAEMFVTRNYFWAMCFVTPLALVGTSLGSGASTQILYDRAVETVIGVAVGVLVVLAMNATTRQREHRTHVVRTP